MKKLPVYGLVILTLANMLNYLDRNLFNSLAPEIQKDLLLSDFQVGLLASAFTYIYIIACPLMGLLGDKYKRPKLLSISIMMWSFATGLAGLARGVWTMAIARSSVGIGEAAYSSIGPSLVEDYVPSKWKARAMGIFLVAVPVGSALGYLLGGMLFGAVGWRMAFFVVGGPGILIALGAYFIKEPNEDLGKNKDPFFTELKNNLKDLIHNRNYMYAVAGYTAFTFVVGAMQVWMPMIIVRTKNMDLANGVMMFGGVTVVSGIIGTFVGSYLADKLRPKIPRIPILLCAISILLGTPFAASVLFIDDQMWFFIVLFICEIFLFANTTPITIVLLESVPADQRSIAMGLSVLAIHAFGDGISPALIGYVSDKTDVITASILLPIGLVVGFVFWYLGYKKWDDPVKTAT